MDKTRIYSLNWTNIGKIEPHDYDARVIPAIEALTKYIAGDIIKNKIYNYILYYYHQGKLTGVLDTLYIQAADGGTKKIAYNISDTDITLRFIGLDGLAVQ